MRIPVRTNQFKKDVKLSYRRAKDMSKLEEIMSDLIDGKPLNLIYQDHPLKGNYIKRRECHIESDWLLIYKLEEESIIFERLGTHSDLYK